MIADRAFRLIPYRDTSGRVATERSAEEQVIEAFNKYSLGTARVRSGYWNDIQGAGGSAYSGSNSILFAAGTSKYKFPDMVTLSLTIPQSQTWAFYGIADYTANPSLQAVQLVQRDVTFPLLYLSPDLYTNEDHKVIFNASFPAVAQNDSMTITLYGTSATTDQIDLLFKVGEKAAQA